VSQLFTVGGPGGILSAGEKFSYISPLTPCSGRRRYKPRSGTTGDSDGYLLAFFDPADELRRVLAQLAESDGVHQSMVAHVLPWVMPRINVVTNTPRADHLAALPPDTTVELDGQPAGLSVAIPVGEHAITLNR
jgi:hypothetical protein